MWTRDPDQQKQTVIDALFGPKEWPGKIRTVVQFLLNYRHVTLRVAVRRLEEMRVRAGVDRAHVERHVGRAIGPTDNCGSDGSGLIS